MRNAAQAPARRAILLLVAAGTLASCLSSPRETSSAPSSSPADVEPLPSATLPAMATDPPAPSAVPSAGPGPVPTDLPEEIRLAIEKRREYGLRADLEWVLAVSADPAAIDHWGFYMLPSEEQAMLARNAYLQAIAGRIRDYTTAHGDEFAGMYLDNEHGLVVTLWTDHVDEHLAGMRGRLDADAPLEARRVRWTLKELRRVQNYIAHHWDWFRRIEAEPQGAGSDLRTNVVEIEISSANADAPRLIAEHYAEKLGVPSEMIRVISDGTGVELMPTGWVEGVVVTADGSRPGRNDLVVHWTPDEAGQCAVPYLGYGVPKTGRVEFICTRGWWTAEARVGDPSTIEPFVTVSDPVRIRVRPGRTTSVRIELRPGVNVRFESQR